MKRGIIIASVLAVLAVTFAWAYWQRGRVMARSRNTDRPGFNEIVVREMPAFKNPLWMLAQYDRNNYQCEFFFTPRGIGRPWSLQTYSFDSLIASTARVEWADEHTATVYLDDSPALICVDGWWSLPHKTRSNTEPSAADYRRASAPQPER